MVAAEELKLTVPEFSPTRPPNGESEVALFFTVPASTQQRVSVAPESCTPTRPPVFSQPLTESSFTRMSEIVPFDVPAIAPVLVLPVLTTCAESTTKFFTTAFVSR